MVKGQGDSRASFPGAEPVELRDNVDIDTAARRVANSGVQPVTEILFT